MCTCRAFYYKSCPWRHVYFHETQRCAPVKLGLQLDCVARIVNSNGPHDFPVIATGTCPVCDPGAPRREAAERTQEQQEAYVASLAQHGWFDCERQLMADSQQ
ncbi:hypothetical protein F4780DRAFT_780444 [Xylariomycetidae sp. FL0641]|nr:hypothetical protein F4780DRAFT_780444 [Xylariomycetidae sp. FL0641]